MKLPNIIKARRHLNCCIILQGALQLILVACQASKATKDMNAALVPSVEASTLAAAALQKGQALPFSHYMYAEIPRYGGDGKLFHAQLSPLTNAAAWQSFKAELKIEGQAFPQVDFSHEVLVALTQSYQQSSQALSIDRLYSQPELSAHLIKHQASPFCTQAVLDRPYLSLHVVKVARSQLAFHGTDLSLPAQVTTVATNEHCLGHAWGEAYLAKQKTVAFTPFLSHANAAQSAAQITLLPMASLWGEWDLFLRQQCPSCLGAPLPAGYPDDYILLAIVDAQPPKGQQGISKLKVQKIYKLGDELVVDVERLVTLCTEQPLNQAMLVVKLSRKDLSDEIPLPQRRFRLPRAFVKESQQACKAPVIP